MISYVYSIIILVVLGFGFVIYVSHQQKIRRENRRDRLQERKEQFMEDLFQSKNKPGSDPNDAVSDTTDAD